MRRFIISLIVIFIAALLLGGNSTAGDIDNGTGSLGGSSNINYSMSDFDEKNVDSTNILNLTMSGGYFIAKNFEIELGIGFIRQETGRRGGA